MRIKFACPHCDRVVRVPVELAGKQGRCPGCKRGLEVPSESTLQSHRRDVERAESQRRASEGKLDKLGRLSDMGAVVDDARPRSSARGRVPSSALGQVSDSTASDSNDADADEDWETAKVLPPAKDMRHCPKCAKQIPLATSICPHCGENAALTRPPWQVTVALCCIICMPLPGLVFAQFGLMAARKRKQFITLAWTAVGLNAFHLVAELLYYLVKGLRS